jgi:hypothetical protein
MSRASLQFFSSRRFFAGEPYPVEPFVMRMPLLDIPATITKAIRALPSQCRAVVISTDLAIPSCVPVLERAARRAGIRILWRTRVRSREPEHG